MKALKDTLLTVSVGGFGVENMIAVAHGPGTITPELIKSIVELLVTVISIIKLFKKDRKKSLPTPPPESEGSSKI